MNFLNISKILSHDNEDVEYDEKDLNVEENEQYLTFMEKSI